MVRFQSVAGGVTDVHQFIIICGKYTQCFCPLERVYAVYGVRPKLYVHCTAVQNCPMNISNGLALSEHDFSLYRSAFSKLGGQKVDKK